MIILKTIMNVFLLLSQPLFFLFIVSFYRFETNYLYSFVKGFFIFIPSYIIYYIFIRFFKGSYNPVLLFGYVFLKGYFLYQFLLLLSFYLLFRKLFPVRNSAELIFIFLAFSAGFYFAASNVDFIIDFNIHDYFTLFFIPFYRISVSLLFAVLLVHYLETFGIYRVFFAGFSVMVLLLASFGKYLYIINYYNFMFFYGIGFILSSCIIFLILCRKITGIKTKIKISPF